MIFSENRFTLFRIMLGSDHRARVTAVRFIVSSTPGFGSSLTDTTVRAGRWSPIIST